MKKYKGDFVKSSLSYWGTADTDEPPDGIDDVIKCSDTDREISYNSTSLVARDGGTANCGGIGGELAARDLTDGSDVRDPYTGKRSIFTYTSNSTSKDLANDLTNEFETNNLNLQMANDGTLGPLAVQDDQVLRARTEEKRIIRYVQGFEYDGTDTPPQRKWPLGDILHSRPVVFNYSPYTTDEENICYEDRGADNKFNSSVIYVGANDGMLHAFRDCDGSELWSFVPEQVLPYLKDTVDGTHQYFVDSAPVAYVHDKDNDGIIEPDSPDKDRVVLIFGLRRGGSADDIASGTWGGYFGIDVTRPYLKGPAHPAHADGAPGEISYGPQMVFSVDSSTSGDYDFMGQSWGQPRLAKVRDDSGEPMVVAFVPGGYSKHEDLRFGNTQKFPDLANTTIVPQQTKDGGLLIGDLTNGVGKTTYNATKLPDSWDDSAPALKVRGRGMYALKIASLVDSGSGYEPNFVGAGEIAWKYDGGDDPDLDYPIASALTAGDLDSDGYMDVLYVGDTGGRMWRFAHNTFTVGQDNKNETVSQWVGNIIFDSNNTAGTIDTLSSGEPDVGRKIFYRPAVSVKSGKPYLWFGTGDRAHPLNHAVVDRLYQIVDNDQVTSDVIDEKNLVDLTEDPLQTGTVEEVTETTDKLYNRVKGPNGEVHYYHGWYIKMNWAFPEYDPDATEEELAFAQGFESTLVGEKMLAAPAMFNGEVYFTTYTPSPDPNADDPCAVGNLGGSHLYHLDAYTGDSVFNYDLTNDTEKVDPETGEKAPVDVLVRADRTRYLGSGIPSGIVTLIDASGRVTMMISSSNRVDTYNAPDIKLISPVYWMRW